LTYVNVENGTELFHACYDGAAVMTGKGLPQRVPDGLGAFLTVICAGPVRKGPPPSRGPADCVMNFMPWILLLAIALTIQQPGSAHAAERPRIVTFCAGCHGTDGIGRNVDIPNIAGQSGIYLRNQLLAFRSGQRKHPQMRISAENLTDREIDQLVAHFAIMPAR
jgi:cytochrome c553